MCPSILDTNDSLVSYLAYSVLPLFHPSAQGFCFKPPAAHAWQMYLIFYLRRRICFVSSTSRNQAGPSL